MTAKTYYLLGSISPMSFCRSSNIIVHHFFTVYFLICHGALTICKQTSFYTNYILACKLPIRSNHPCFQSKLNFASGQISWIELLLRFKFCENWLKGFGAARRWGGEYRLSSILLWLIAYVYNRALIDYARLHIHCVSKKVSPI